MIVAKPKIGKLPKPILHTRKISASGKSTYKGGKPAALHIPRKPSIGSGNTAFGRSARGMAFPDQDSNGL